MSRRLYVIDGDNTYLHISVIKSFKPKNVILSQVFLRKKKEKLINGSPKIRAMRSEKIGEGAIRGRRVQLAE